MKKYFKDCSIEGLLNLFQHILDRFSFKQSEWDYNAALHTVILVSFRSDHADHYPNTCTHWLNVNVFCQNQITFYTELFNVTIRIGHLQA